MKKIFITFMILLMIMQVIACGPRQAVHNEQIPEKKNQSELDISSIANLDGRDNTLDPYSFTVHTDLGAEPEEDYVISHVNCAILENNVYFLTTQLSEKKASSLKDMEIMDKEDNITRERTDNGEDSLEEVGEVVGTDQIIQVLLKGGDVEDDLFKWEYSFQIVDENQQVIKTIPLPYLEEDPMPRSEAFVKGITNPVLDEEGKIYYVVNSKELEILSPDNERKSIDLKEQIVRTLQIMIGYDDNLYLLYQWVKTDDKSGIKISKDQNQLYRINGDEGTLTLLCEIEEDRKKFRDIYYMAMLNDSTVIYMDPLGIYQMDLDTKETSLLYLWARHGINPKGIEKVRVYDGKIKVIYRTDSDWKYLCLEPTTEKIPMQTITFATTEYMAGIYRPIIANFNKSHPNYSIEIKTDYDSTALLTQLVAGDGPVLIDTGLTEFEGNEKLWEPLDEVFAELKISDELQPNVMELGKINGTLYGVINSFYIDTVVVGDKNIQNWDYNTFLKCIHEGSDRKAIVNSYDMESDGTRFLYNFFMHDIEDNYFFDKNTGKTIFNEKKFTDLLSLTNQYVVRKDYVNAGKEVLDGSVLCNNLIVTRPEEIAMYRIIYGDDVNYIGYPGKDGAVNYLCSSSSPLAIRRTASKEDKELAVAFMRDMLSYDAHMSMKKDYNYFLSIRKDVLETQIEDMTKDTVALNHYFDSVALGNRVDKEKDRETLYNLIRNAKPQRELPRDLKEIMDSELHPYFEGTITEENLIKNLDNRVKLYLMEQW